VTTRIPQFGTRLTGRKYTSRPSAYAVVRNRQGEIAVVRAPIGVFLPGGGQLPLETPEQAAIRETREECGLEIEIVGEIGVADQYAHSESEDRYFAKRSTFLRAVVIAFGDRSEMDHELLWISEPEAGRLLSHASHQWAISHGSLVIDLARRDDVAALPAIERAASELFEGWAVAENVAQDETSLEELAFAQRAGLLWVARGAYGEPVGFALVELLAGEPHLEEIDVLPSHGRRGAGRALIDAVKAWVRAAGHRSLTLTTFRDIPWNAPWYAQLGFRVLAAEELSPSRRAVVADEASRGLDPATRVVMIWTGDKNAPAATAAR
jgi:ADP-ribose pyrophosphatase YjhB (NUDIX family)